MDLVGNRRTETKDGEVTTYAYDDNNRLLTEAKDAPGSASDTFTVYEYDATVDGLNNGNGWTVLTGETVHAGGSESGAVQSQTKYTYDVQDQMKTAAVNSDGDAYVDVTDTYGYDDNGIRTSKQTVTNPEDDGEPGDNTTATIEYVIDASNPTGYAQVLEEWTLGGGVRNLSRAYVIGQDILGQSVGSSMRYFLADGHGSTRLVLSASAGVVQADTYDAYGNLLEAPESTVTNILFDGEQSDKTTGFVYLRARYYDPRTGRFTTQDPYAGSPYEPITLHKYLYCGANPVIYSDPSGCFTQPDGYDAEEEIRERYEEERPDNDVDFGRLIQQLGIKPDIVDYTSDEFYEIKPLTISGLANSPLKKST